MAGSITTGTNGNWYDGIPLLQEFGNLFNFADNALTGDRDFERQQYLQEQNNLFNSAEATKDRAWREHQAELERLYNSAEAEKNRQFQKDLSVNAIQYRAEDARKAGFNPLGLLGDGTTVGSGATARSTAPNGVAASAVPVSAIHSNTNIGNTFKALADTALQLSSIEKGLASAYRTAKFAKGFKVAEQNSSKALVALAKALDIVL